MALRHGTCMDEESFRKTCIKEKRKRGGTHQPFYGTWVNVMLLWDAGRFMLGKYLSGKKEPARSWEKLSGLLEHGFHEIEGDDCG